MSCVIFALDDDIHVDAVVSHLKDFSTDFIRIDPYNQPVEIFYDSHAPDSVIINGKLLKIKEISGIFCRLALESLSVESEDPVSVFSFKEYLASIIGIFLLAPEKKWINFPWFESYCDNKIYPLISASFQDFNVPNFIVSNSINRLTEHALTKKSIIKPITDTSIAYQSGKFAFIPDFAPFKAPYTTILDSEKITSELMDDTPSLLQLKINSVSEIRVLCLDELVFSTISDSNKLHTDIRMHSRINENVFDLPSNIHNDLINLMGVLRLRFCTFDFLVDENKSYWLVDINPSGNWLWQDELYGSKISLSIAKKLSYER